jgi:hypothetical protein
MKRPKAQQLLGFFGFPLPKNSAGKLRHTVATASEALRQPNNQTVEFADLF